jgi:transcriptional regulator with XRE-family HTH domain
MTINEKLKRLTRFMHKAAVCRAALVGENTLWRIIDRQQMPSASVAFRLAQALGVDVGWLLDDSASWPPVRLDEPPCKPGTTGKRRTA